MATSKSTQRPRVTAPRLADPPLSDSERLAQAAHILIASIVANDTTHALDFHLTIPMEAADALIRNVIKRRRNRKGIRAERFVPGRPPASVIERLRQASTILTVSIVANETDPHIYREINFSHALHAALELVDEVKEELDAESSKEFAAQNPKLMREMREAKIMSTRPMGHNEGKPN